MGYDMLSPITHYTHQQLLTPPPPRLLSRRRLALHRALYMAGSSGPLALAGPGDALLPLLVPALVSLPQASQVGRAVGVPLMPSPPVAAAHVTSSAWVPN